MFMSRNLEWGSDAHPHFAIVGRGHPRNVAELFILCLQAQDIVLRSSQSDWSQYSLSLSDSSYLYFSTSQNSVLHSPQRVGLVPCPYHHFVSAKICGNISTSLTFLLALWWWSPEVTIMKLLASLMLCLYTIEKVYRKPAIGCIAYDFRSYSWASLESIVFTTRWFN